MIVYTKFQSQKTRLKVSKGSVYRKAKIKFRSQKTRLKVMVGYEWIKTNPGFNLTRHD